MANGGSEACALSARDPYRPHLLTGLDALLPALALSPCARGSRGTRTAPLLRPLRAHAAAVQPEGCAGTQASRQPRHLDRGRHVLRRDARCRPRAYLLMHLLPPPPHHLRQPRSHDTATGGPKADGDLCANGHPARSPGSARHGQQPAGPLVRGRLGRPTISPATCSGLSVRCGRPGDGGSGGKLSVRWDVMEPVSSSNSSGGASQAATAR